MFLRIKKVGGNKYLYLEKRMKVDGKVKSKVIKYLGRATKANIAKCRRMGYVIKVKK